MARAAAHILTSIWRDDAFLTLPASAQRLYLCLLSQPDLNHLGVLPMALARWASMAPGLTEGGVAADLAALADARFVVFDAGQGQVLIRTFIRHDRVYRQPNVLRAARAAIPTVFSARLAEALLEELVKLDGETVPASVPEILNEMKQQLKAIAAKGSANPSRNPSRNPPRNPSANPSANPSEKGSPNPLGDRGKGLGVTTEVMVTSAPVREPERRRGTRVPEPFPVTAEMVAWWRERCSHVDARHETEKFVNYWRAKTGAQATKLDWVATWRNWMLTAAERLPSRPTAGEAPKSTGELRAEQAVQAGEALQRRMEGGGP